MSCAAADGHGLAHYLATVSFLPQCVPSIVIGLAFIFVYVRFPIPIYGTLWIIALAMTTRYLAFSSRTTTSALMQVHGELEEASQMSGARWTQTLRSITMPLFAPAMINVFLWVAVHAMQELSMALMLYNPDTVVVSTMIWSMWQNGRTADAAVLGLFSDLAFRSCCFLRRPAVSCYFAADPSLQHDSRLRIWRKPSPAPRGSAGAARRVLRGGQGRIIHVARSERLRQNDDAALHRGSGTAVVGRNPDQ